MKFWFLLGIQSVCILLLLIVFFKPEKTQQNSEALQKVANELVGAGLESQAVKHYDDYFKSLAKPTEGEKNYYFKIALIQKEQNQKAAALEKIFYLKHLNPSPKLSQKINKEIVSLLESLGKTQASKAVLNQSTHLSSQKNKSHEVIASIGQNSLTVNDLKQRLTLIPKDKKTDLDQAKKELVGDWVAKQILSEKAKRLGLEKSITFQKAQKVFESEFLTQEVIRLEKAKPENKDIKEKELIQKLIKSSSQGDQIKVNWERVKQL